MIRQVEIPWFILEKENCSCSWFVMSHSNKHIRPASTMKYTNRSNRIGYDRTKAKGLNEGRPTRLTRCVGSLRRNLIHVHVRVLRASSLLVRGHALPPAPPPSVVMDSSVSHTATDTEMVFFGEMSFGWIVLFSWLVLFISRAVHTMVGLGRAADAERPLHAWPPAATANKKKWRWGKYDTDLV